MGVWLRVASLDEVEEGEGLRVDTDHGVVALFRCGGEILAVGDTCTHGGGPLSEESVWEATVECPVHGAEFDLRT